MLLPTAAAAAASVPADAAAAAVDRNILNAMVMLHPCHQPLSAYAVGKPLGPVAKRLEVRLPSAWKGTTAIPSVERPRSLNLPMAITQSGCTLQSGDARNRILQARRAEAYHKLPPFQTKSFQ